MYPASLAVLPPFNAQSKDISMDGVVLEKMTVVKLRSLLKHHKLSTAGNKNTLIERLQVSLCHQHGMRRQPLE